VLGGGITAIVTIATSRGTKARTANRAVTAGALPNGPLSRLNVAGPLALAPDGALYVTNVPGRGSAPGDRVLVRLPDGRFRVIAGNGDIGFSGDGGPAVRARLASVSDLAVAHDGTLYIADGGRVRAVDRDGLIHTVVGNGRPLRTIANDTAALSAALGTTQTHGDPLQITLSPSGHLYIATAKSQILRLTADGRLRTVRALVTSGPGKGPLGGPYPIAVDAHGNIDVGGGPGGWTVWQVAPNGIAHLVSGHRFARGSGSTFPVLQLGPGSAVYAAAGAIFQIKTHKLIPVWTFDRPLSTIDSRHLNGQDFPLTYFTLSPHGTLYADDLPGAISGYEEHQQLLTIANGHVHLLWQETNTTPK
jgi:hypothetical protein